MDSGKTPPTNVGGSHSNCRAEQNWAGLMLLRETVPLRREPAGQWWTYAHHWLPDMEPVTDSLLLA